MVQVSVLMPSYNHQQYISEAIESVLNQTYPDFELVIVDDASTDNTKEIIQNYQKRNPRIRALFHEKNRGISQTGNDCLSAAQGKYVAFIGSDDLWLPQKLEKQIRVLEANEDRVVWSEGTIIDSQGTETGQTFTDFNACGDKPKSGRIYQEIINENYIFGQSTIFKKEFCKSLSFDSGLRYLGDYKFMVDLAYEHDFFFIPEPLAKYRIHGKNSISRDNTSWLHDRINLRTYFLKAYGEHLSGHLKGIQYLKIGEAYTGLNLNATAKKYYRRALRTDFCSKESILYLAHASGSERMHRFLFGVYKRL